MIFIDDVSTLIGSNFQQFYTMNILPKTSCRLGFSKFPKLIFLFSIFNVVIDFHPQMVLEWLI